MNNPLKYILAGGRVRIILIAAFFRQYFLHNRPHKKPRMRDRVRTHAHIIFFLFQASHLLLGGCYSGGGVVAFGTLTPPRGMPGCVLVERVKCTVAGGTHVYPDPSSGSYEW